jgi:GT2 family glycosyltransferase
MQTDTRPLSLIILAWNHCDLTRRCLESLAGTDLAGAEVIVVDNGSTDQTPAVLTTFEWVRVVRLARNLGFTGGNNAGIAAAAKGSDIVLLNNDLLFSQRDWLTRLRECAHAEATIGVVGCRLVLPDGRLLHAGTYILPDTCWGQQIGALQKDVGQYRSSRDVEGVVFACAYIKREVIDRLGGLSTEYESYFEDTDYCLRAREAGFRVVFCGAVCLTHDEHGSTRDDPAAFARLFERSREIFRKRWFEPPRHYRRELLWQSILNAPSGYAVSSREILRALEAEGVRSVYRYVYGPGTVFPVIEPAESGDHLLDVVSARTSREPSVAVVYGQGDALGANGGKYKIGFTMLEVDTFPASWVAEAQKMDEVWVPSEFNRQGLHRSGVTRPIHVVPLGADANHFHPEGAAYPNPAREFLFLSVFEWGARKAPELLLKTFNATFSAREPVRLLVKIMNQDQGISVNEEIRRLDLKPSGGRISYLCNVEFPHYQLAALYRSADCYVAASRGEGWDLPLMEAMGTGRPSIATDWGAHTEYVREGVAYPLRIRGTVRVTGAGPYYEGRSWADPDPEHLRHLLRWVFEHQDEARRVGAAAAHEVARRWTWQRTAQVITGRLEAIGV